jgi:osmotically-inducible protein OsmY
MSSTSCYAGIEVDLPAETSNRTELAENLLHHSQHLALRRVWCEMAGDALVLHGSLPSYFLKQMAQSTVAQADGVQQIVNEIEVIGLR